MHKKVMHLSIIPPEKSLIAYRGRDRTLTRDHFDTAASRSFLPAGSGQGAALASNEMRIVTYNVLGPLQVR